MLIKPRWVSPRTGWLDLDDVRAPIGQDASCRRNESELRHFKNPEAFHHMNHNHLVAARAPLGPGQENCGPAGIRDFNRSAIQGRAVQ